MKKSKEFMDEFMRIMDNMKKYQKIDINNPETYGFDSGIVHEAFEEEKRIIARYDIKDLKDVNYENEEKNKQLKLNKTKNDKF